MNSDEYYAISIQLLLSCCDEILINTDVAFTCVELMPAAICRADANRIEFIILLLEGHLRKSKSQTITSIFYSLQKSVHEQAFQTTVHLGKNYLRQIQSKTLESDVTWIFESACRREQILRLIVKLNRINEKHDYNVSDTAATEEFLLDPHIDQMVRFLNQEYRKPVEKPKQLDIGTIEKLGAKAQQNILTISEDTKDPLYSHVFRFATASLVNACKIQCLRQTGHAGSEIQQPPQDFTNDFEQFLERLLEDDRFLNDPQQEFELMYY